jgi:HAE1 family hydrophobic/amphiphilic exporter-1
MSIYESSVKRPLTTIMVFIAMIVLGLYSMSKLPLDLYPEIELPAISVYTYYPGASAIDIETNVTEIIENRLSTVSNLKEISSRSFDNTSVITLEFEWGTDLDEASNDIRDAISFAEQLLPEDCESPMIFKFNSSQMPILFYTVTADESYPALEKILDEKLVNPLNRIDGLANVSINGAPGREIAIEVDPRKLEAYNLSVEAIGGIIQAENLNLPAGNLKMGKLDYPLRIQGEFTESDYIENIVIGSFQGQSIYVRDVATVKDSLREMSLDSRVDGRRGVTVVIQKQSGGNTVKVAKEVRQELEKIKKTLPPDVQIQTIMDSSDFIEGSISNLTKTLVFALIFVVIVVLFFLGRWRATFIVVITIPISLIVAFIYLFATGNSINIISLSSLSIAIGMVVDDAIVVLENISKHIDRGSNPREASIYATNEVWLAVIVTTMTIVAVFFPITLVGGMTGILFKQLGMIVTITAITSTVVAITLTPMLSSKLLKLQKKFRKKKNGEQKLNLYDRSIKKSLDKLDVKYGQLLSWVLTHKLIVVAVAFIIFVSSLFLTRIIGTDFIPEADQGQVRAKIELQTGIRVEETVILARKIDAILMNEFPEVRFVSTSAGANDQGGFGALFSTSGSHIINYNVRLVDVDERKRDVWEIAEDLRKRLAIYPEIVNYNVSTGRGMGGFGGAQTVDVEIMGYDISQTNIIAQQIADSLENISGARDIEISREKSKPELQVKLDQEKLSYFGLTTAQVSMAIRNRVEGLIASQYRETGDEYDIVIRHKEEFRNTISDIENISVTNNQGISVRIKDIGSVEEYYAPPSIERKRKERIVTVKTTPYGRSLGELAADVEKIINNIDIPSGVNVQISGAFEDQMESFTDLGLLMILSLILVYIVMASQFESLRMPFIIMFSIPFAFSGVLFALYLTGTTLSIIAGIGAVMLIGIVVKNGIVLVDFINLMRDKGMEVNEAITVSGQSRLRPVLMTSLTTILGMLPLAISTGEGAEIWSPMGIAVIGGLLFSTLITLLIIPAMYAVMAKKGSRHKKKIAFTKYDFLDE